MNRSNIKTSGFSLAKRKDLTGDDFYDVNMVGNIMVAVVCDGVGSARYGKEASRRITNYLINNFKIRPKAWSIEKTLRSFIESINSILYQESIENYERVELLSTLAVVVIDGNRLYGANVGDSRVYLHRDAKLNQLSNDHIMNDVGYEGVLTQAIGMQKSVNPYYFENIIQKDDRLLLCSDGLYNTLDDETLRQNIHLGAHVLVKKASTLANDNLSDDTTAVVLEILELNEMESLKRQNVDIPESLSKDMIIDGYVLKKSLIPNNRTWLCLKKTKEYVLKFAPSEAIEDEKILDLFVKEAWNAKRLKADFFPKTVIPKNRTNRYYVMQLIKGEDLHSLLKSKTLSIDDTINLGKFLLKMSQFLLKYDLVHGDIKPQNIMVVNGGMGLDFKMIDFGNITEIFSTETKAGTASYIAPERFQKEAISESSEIFSIGVTMYRLLTLKYPYGEIEPFQTPVFHEPKKPSFYNKNIPDWLDSVILHSIAKEKNQRYAHYSEMAYEISSPQKVKPFFSKNASLIERSPLAFYKCGFIIMIAINLTLLVWINS